MHPFLEKKNFFFIPLSHFSIDAVTLNYILAEIIVVENKKILFYLFPFFALIMHKSAEIKMSYEWKR